MCYYASGDTRKMIQTSEDDEGYENQSSCTTISVRVLNQSDDKEKQCFTIGISPEIPPVPLPLISDDTDRSFWAEDELSNSESRQQLNKKKKRKRSLSYRNRIAVHRSRSLLFQSSSSSLDSVSEQISPGVSKQERFTSRFNNEQPGQSNVKKKYAQKRGACCSKNVNIIYASCKNFNQKQTRKRRLFLMTKKFRR